MLALLAVVFCSGAAPVSALEIYEKTAFSTDVSDLWWNPSESGWGVQLVQEANVVFATAFIYGADGRPTWVAAQLQAGGVGIFSGPLYVTSGPWFGGAFNPGNVGVRQAGTMTFQLATVESGTLSYSIDGVVVNKQVTRQTLVFENFSGDFVIGAKVQATACFNPANSGTVSGAMELNISHSGNAMTMLWQFLNGTICTYTGVYDQSGHMGGMTGTFSCTTGEFGTMRLFELTNKPGVMSGRIRGVGTNTGCQYTGYFSGIDPNKPPK